MNRRLLPLMAAELFFGSASLIFSQPAFAVAGACLIIFSHLYLTDQKKIIRILIPSVLMLSLFAGLFRGRMSVAQQRAVSDFVKPEGNWAIEGELIKKEKKTDYYGYWLKNVNVCDYVNDKKHPEDPGIHTSKVLVCMDEDVVPMGAHVLLKAETADMHRAENEGGFDEAAYLASNGVFAKFYGEKVLRWECRRFSIRRILYALRCGMNSAMERSLPGEEGALLSSMVTGTRDGLAQDVRDIFSDAGLAHILAISGLHISILGMSVMKFLRKAGISVALSAGIAGVFVILFGILTGEPVSAQRAAGMFIIMAGAQAAGVEYDIYSALGVMALIMVFIQPEYVRNSSFILSFTAVFGAAYCGRRLSEEYERRLEEKWRKTHYSGRGHKWKIRFHEKIISSAIGVTGLQLFALPVTAYFFFSVSVYSVILNLILLPLMSVMLVLAFTGSLIGCLFFPVGRIILVLCHPILYLYEASAAFTLKLPLSDWIIGRPAPGVIAVYYLLIFILVPKVSWPERYLRALAVSSVLILGVIHLRLPVPFEIDVLSVGQGDGIYVNSGYGYNMFIDGGSTSNENVGRYTILPFLKCRAVRRIDLWFISHLDADHYNGFVQLLERGYRVRTLVLAESVEKNGAYTSLVKLCKERRVKVRYVKSGDIIEIKSIMAGREPLKVLILFPDSPSQFSGTNENSLVFKLSRRDFSAVFTGDIGEEQERYITKMGFDLSADLLKSSHHGSNSSNCREWLVALNPELTVFSAGKGNRYGHPGKDTLARLEELNQPHLCTIDCGQIKVRFRGGKMKLEKFLD